MLINKKNILNYYCYFKKIDCTKLHTMSKTNHSNKKNKNKNKIKCKYFKICIYSIKKETIKYKYLNKNVINIHFK